VLLVTHHGHAEEVVNLISVRKVGGESKTYQEILEG
jgi:hypothetical protein